MAAQRGGALDAPRPDRAKDGGPGAHGPVTVAGHLERPGAQGAASLVEDGHGQRSLVGVDAGHQADLSGPLHVELLLLRWWGRTRRQLPVETPIEAPIKSGGFQRKGPGATCQSQGHREGSELRRVSSRAQPLTVRSRHSDPVDPVKHRELRPLPEPAVCPHSWQISDKPNPTGLLCPRIMGHSHFAAIDALWSPIYRPDHPRAASLGWAPFAGLLPCAAVVPYSCGRR